MRQIRDHDRKIKQNVTGLPRTGANKLTAWMSPRGGRTSARKILANFINEKGYFRGL